ncbi:MAG: bifunctional precorrin-2 dehydrogenase/sirohydrochlorin ferrochelatase, partial [Spirochaetia bacterium]|nr:bifunctional precorrin-2 dehydrogenase/sirohydrochlorin ferrochelatase [Spirochaetia bacterium]
ETGSSNPKKPALFPVFLNLKNRSVLVIGGGKVASEKIRNLRGTEAKVSVIAQKVSNDAKALLDAKEISSIEEREIVESDLLGKHLVIAATNDHATNVRLAGWARKAGILFNAVDDPENCDFFTGAVIDHGPVRISLSSEGGLPGLSSYLRKVLALLLPKAHAPLWEKLAALRKRLKGILPGSENRMNAMRAVMQDLEKKYFNLNEAKAGDLMETSSPEKKNPSQKKEAIPPNKSERKKSEIKEVHGV